MALNTYSMFSNDTWKLWEKTGKSEVNQKIKQLIKETEVHQGKSSFISFDSYESGLPKALYELISAVVKGHLRKDYAKTFINELLVWHTDIPSIFVEVVSMIEMEVTTVDRLCKQRDQLLSLVKLINLESLYKERLEIDTLGDAAIVKCKKTFLTKQIKVRTKMFYKQQKFNLLREESEGYSKLITELNQDISSAVNPSSIIQIIRSLIGCFNLDPNRVLDMILEAFEMRPEEHVFFTELISKFPHEAVTISEIIGFKLSNCIINGENNGLYIMVALLLQNNILCLKDVYSWLEPEDSSMIKKCEDIFEVAKDFAKKMTIVSTKDKDKEKDNEKEDEEIMSIEFPLEDSTGNQKLLLAVALLKVGEWKHFLEVADNFPKYYLVSFPEVARQLCELIQYLIHPLYERHSGLKQNIRKQKNDYCNQIISMKPCETIDELMDVAFPMISVLGPHICHNISLIYYVLRISRSILSKKDSLSTNIATKFYYELLSILDESLLPSVSMFYSNPCVAAEIWETVKLYPYQHRYKLYASWKNESHNYHPLLLSNRTKSLKKAKHIMMRITKETIKPVSRCIGKLSHNFPGPIFEYILKQVQLYDNLIGPVVDSFKYLNSLSYDVLGYCLVEAFCSPKDRTLGDGAAIAPWLQSLSSFTGSVCKKYTIELGGILQFVANRLKDEHSTDLLILKDIVQKMGGADSLDDLTPDQMEAMCGGDILKKEAGQYLQEKNTKRSSIRLKEALLENNLAIPLLLLMAQQRSSIIFRQTDTSHLKLIGKLYDQCQATLVQVGTFISQVITIEELSSKLPPIGALLSEYKISTDVSFFLNRLMFFNNLMNKYDEIRKKDRSEKKLSVEGKKKLFIESFNSVLSPVSTLVRPHYEAKVWDDLSINLFLTFWTLSISDLEVPLNIYEKEQKKLAEMMSSKSRKREIERISSLKDKLEDEKRRQVEHIDRIAEWFAKEKDDWFKIKVRNAKHDTLRNFLQHCIFPRCTFTMLDAIYCAKFIKMLHSMKTEYFSTLLYLDMLFVDIGYSLTSCTEHEVNNYALFLQHSLELVMHWHSSRDTFEKECINFPGFITKYKLAFQENNDYVDYENYRHVVYKWHYKITKALVKCLESGEYTQIRNAILILQGILPSYPLITNLSVVISKKIEKVKQNEKAHRNDLYVLANSYSGRLKTKSGSLMVESDFHLTQHHEAQRNRNLNSDADKKTKKEVNGIVNGDDPSKSPKKTESRTLKEDKRKHDEDAKEEPEKKKRKEDKNKEKPKRKKETKKKGDSGSDSLDERDDNGSNDGPPSGRMEPPEVNDASRSSKRRKVDVDSKLGVQREEKRGKGSPQSEEICISPKERKRSSPPVEKTSRKSQRVR